MTGVSSVIDDSSQFCKDDRSQLCQMTWVSSVIHVGNIAYSPGGVLVLATIFNQQPIEDVDNLFGLNQRILLSRNLHVCIIQKALDIGWTYWTCGLRTPPRPKLAMPSNPKSCMFFQGKRNPFLLSTEKTKLLCYNFLSRRLANNSC